MKKSIFMSLVAFVLLSTSGLAQNQLKTKNGKKGHREKIIEKKLAFLKKNMGLNEEESRKFEKVFRQYAKKKFEIRKTYNKEIYQKVKKDKLQELSEEEKQNIIKQKMDLDRQLFELNNGFIKKLNEILPPEKVIKYFILERRFKDKLMRRVVKRRKTMQHRKEMKHKPGGQMIEPRN